MWLLTLLLILPAAVYGPLVGRLSWRYERRPCFAGLFAVALSALVGWGAWNGAVTGVPADRVALGVTAFSLGTLVWVGIFVALGRAIRRTWTLFEAALVCAAIGALPAFWGSLWADGLIECQPGQYECPL